MVLLHTQRVPYSKSKISNNPVPIFGYSGATVFIVQTEVLAGCGRAINLALGSLVVRIVQTLGHNSLTIEQQ
jgi:hypothetical protein